MSKMSRSQFMRWERLRLRGMKYFVLRTAVVFGILFFLIFNLVSWIWNGWSLPTSLFFIYPMTGLLTGFVKWLVNERRYENFLSDKKIRLRR